MSVEKMKRAFTSVTLEAQNTSCRFATLLTIGLQVHLNHIWINFRVCCVGVYYFILYDQYSLEVLGQSKSLGSIHQGP